MHAQVVLTPAESKRLIARGVVASTTVQAALKAGIVAVGKGTTNSYVVEELLGKPIDKQRYVTGLRLPVKADRAWIPEGRLDDVVLKEGKPVDGATTTGIISQMTRGDVFVKGANAVEPSRKMAGIYLGHSAGGTIGAVCGTIAARGIRLVIPVGLEKLVCSSIADLAAQIQAAVYESGEQAGFMPVCGEIITEIEALQILHGVTAMHMGSGGVGGAEGSVHLLIEGDKENVSAAVAHIGQIQGEKPFAGLSAC